MFAVEYLKVTVLILYHVYCNIGSYNYVQLTMNFLCQGQRRSITVKVMQGRSIMMLESEPYRILFLVFPGQQQCQTVSPPPSPLSYSLLDPNEETIICNAPASKKKELWKVSAKFHFAGLCRAAGLPCSRAVVASVTLSV